MPMLNELLDVPDDSVTPAEARQYLQEFISWVESFLWQIADSTEQVDQSTYQPLFEAELISFLEPALSEAEDQNYFGDVINLIDKAEEAQLAAHGLAGVQLQWKITNINFWMERFVTKPTAAILDRLISSIDALLKSVLGAVGGGSAIEEIKEAMRNCMTLSDLEE